MKSSALSAFCGLGLACFFTGCGDHPVAPVRLPDNAVEFSSPFLAQWWQQAEACSGKTGDFTSIHWYIVPGVGSFSVGYGPDPSGAYYPTLNSIVLAEYVDGDGTVVRHEALHAILHVTDHPPEYFRDKCGPLVTP